MTESSQMLSSLKSLLRLAEKYEDFAVAERGEWNTLEINCRGQNITTIHNGVMIVAVSPSTHPKILLRQRKGYLGLQNHGGGVKFRNLRIGPAITDYHMRPEK